jgi:hypothetical protein
VRLFFDGAAIDVARYEQQGVARFSLGTTPGAPSN